MKTKVAERTWKRSMRNLMERRRSGSSSSSAASQSKTADYGSHIRKANIGKSVLDIGCGSMAIKKFLPQGTKYIGIDAFPVSDEVLKMRAEDLRFEDQSFDTVLAFAVLDGLQDLLEALGEMKRVCSGNLLILTGIGIEPDQYHTLMISEELLNSIFSGWRISLKEYLEPKVLLIEYSRE